MEIEINDIVQVNSSWYGRVIDIFNGDDVRKTRYRVVPLDGRSAERWVNAEQIVSYNALRAAFGRIDSIEKEIEWNLTDEILQQRYPLVGGSNHES